MIDTTTTNPIPGLTQHTPKWGDRYYTWQTTDGEIKLPSVTTYLNGGIPKPWLGGWVAKEIATKMVTMANDDPNYMLKRLEDDDAEKWVKGLPYAGRGRAADLGSLVHRIAEHISLNEPWEHLITPEAEPYITGYQTFWHDFKPTLIASEAPVLNITRVYAGTLDAIMEIGPYQLLVDYKTGKGIYDEVSLQLAAYRHAEYIGLPDQGVIPMLPVDGAAVLHLQPNTYTFHLVPAGDQEWRSFLYAREVYRWTRDKRPIGTPIEIPDHLALSDYVDPIGTRNGEPE